MRSLIVVLMLVLSSALLLPACHEDWGVLGHELELTADELGGALDRWCDVLDEGECEDARQLAGSVEAWTRDIEADLDVWATSVESDADALGSELEHSFEQLGRDVELSLEQLGRELELFFESFGRSLEQAADEFVRWLESLD